MSLHARGANNVTKIFNNQFIMSEFPIKPIRPSTSPLIFTSPESAPFLTYGWENTYWNTLFSESNLISADDAQP